MTKANPLVDFLAAYGPQPSSNNLYDEFVVEAATKTGCAPIEISQPLTEKLVDLLKSKPKTVILTGTAGDGKTYTARKIAEALYGEAGAWDSTQKTFEMPLDDATGKQIKFLKDLSEHNEIDKKRIYPEIAESLRGNGETVFVICVNDGHLLKFFRDRADDDMRSKIADMLRCDCRDDPNFLLVNLSRQSHGELVENILDGIVQHPRWKDCEGCPALIDRENPCPIRCNLEILRDKEPTSMRARIKDMVRISAADGRHLSIRQLILITVNILLGDAKSVIQEDATGASLLTCEKAKERAKENAYNATNPYSNAFGANLSPRARRQYGAFVALGEFGVGYETNNYFDRYLLWHEDSISSSPMYGQKIFDETRKSYQADPSNNVTKFRNGMICQRRRLFFSLDPQNEAVVRGNHNRDPWNLTAFKHAYAYIEMWDSLVEDGKMPKTTARSLLRGLNRMMTGDMTTTEEELWLIAPSGVYLGREISLLFQKAGRRTQGGGIISFLIPNGTTGEAVDSGRPPLLRFETRSGDGNPVDLPLSPTLFECLLRVADGALPANFSTECRRTIERFQLHAASAVREACQGNLPHPTEVRMNDSDGKLQELPIPIMSGEEAW